MQLDLATPDYSTLSRRQGSLAVVLPTKQTDLLDRPMHLVVDVYDEWKVRHKDKSFFYYGYMCRDFLDCFMADQDKDGKILRARNKLVSTR